MDRFAWFPEHNPLVFLDSAERTWLDPYPALAPLITSPPEPNTPTAFNEDEFVSLWTGIYDIFIELNFVRRDQVIFPPQDTGRHPGIGKDRLHHELHMSPEAISLVERLLYPKIVSPQYRTHFFIEAIAINYLEEEDLRECRDPHWSYREGAQSEPAADYLLPHDVALTLPYEDEGLTWILDIKYNAIRCISRMAEPPSTSFRPPEDFASGWPDEPGHYRNWPAYSAPFILRQYAQDLLDMRIVPYSTTGEHFARSNEMQGQIIDNALSRHGWPHNFQTAAWAQASGQIYSDTIDEESRRREELDPWRYGADEREIVREWIRNPELIPDVGYSRDI
ncbi:hypothetical protein B0I35DRAFT_446899 [Stachybotrys elegans]|uniref:Uncharacterized protein n=1 Tax=Stachybotrys elegans TaxID=80388 RepID=A0A8K0WJC0_9HYPO|nr:hypothetical protein B0I35DRAFT_446899 [Stachybotrys elegans]